MANKVQVSSKHLQITKANSVVVITVAVAALITTFSLVAARAVLVKRSYQSRVIAEKTKAADQLKENLEAVDSLVNSYKAFIDQQENVIGGASAGKGEKDGDNAKIILDALPSSYDFPALATSLEKILAAGNYSGSEISGVDDEIAQSQATSTGKPIEMPFQISAGGSYESVLELIKQLDLSIRPIHITGLTLSKTDATVDLSITAKTFYQPEKKLNITTKVVE